MDRDARRVRSKNVRAIGHARAPDVPPRLPAKCVVDDEEGDLCLRDEAQREFEDDPAERIEIPHCAAEEPMPGALAPDVGPALCAGEAREVFLPECARRDDEAGHGVTAQTKHPAVEDRQKVGEARRRKDRREAQGEIAERRYKRYHHDPFLHAGIDQPAFRRNGSSSLAALETSSENGETQA